MTPKKSSAHEPGEIAGIEVDYSDIGPGVSPRERATGYKRMVQIGLGVLLVVVGIPMIPLVGPGWAVVLVGLNLIKPDNHLVRWLRRKLPVVPDEGPVPRRYYVIGALLLILSSVFGWFYGAESTNWVRDALGV
ncbi:MAG: hypothetical protein OER95_06205 [Acidimicrobiia bacterium]|nr:hypothetical protein [Acidimicrobiia bacterium]